MKGAGGVARDRPADWRSVLGGTQRVDAGLHDGPVGAGGDGRCRHTYMAYGLQGDGGPGFGRRAGDPYRHSACWPASSWASAGLPGRGPRRGGCSGDPPDGDEQFVAAHGAGARRTCRSPLAAWPARCWGQADKIETASGEPGTGSQPPLEIPGNHPRATLRKACGPAFRLASLRFLGNSS